jgi:hypothetical protein
MPIFYTTPFDLTYQTLIRARITAYNSYGYALLPSDPNLSGALVLQVPDQM